MSNPILTATEPQAGRFECFRSAIVTNHQIAKDTFEVMIDCPTLAAKMLPGQFAMLRIAKRFDAILGRAFAMWDRGFDGQGNPQLVKFVYLRKGRMTSPLADLAAGNSLDVWGPLGNGFSNAAVDHLILVAGGVGQTPMLVTAAEALGTQSFGVPARSNAYTKRVTLCYGARSKDFLAGLLQFEQAGIQLKLTTDDGSHGEHGPVTLPLKKLLEDRDLTHSVRIACCGPEPMMQAVAKIAAEHNVSCEVSLETPMACGIGICYSCVAKVKQPDGGWDYRRTCIEGPIFDAGKIEW